MKTGKERALAEGLISLNFSHNLLQRKIVEKIFAAEDKVKDVKDRVHLMTGSRPEFMTLMLNGKMALDNDNWTIGYYGAASGDWIHVIDNDPNSKAKGGALEDVRLVKKYVMTEADYERRENTFRAYKKKMVEKDPNWKPVWEVKAEEARKKKLDELLAKVAEETIEPVEEVHARIQPGMRCEVSPGGRRGEVMYVGEVPEISSVLEGRVWIGVKFDEAVGKSDGEIKGKRYFQTEPMCGGFLKSLCVAVGDYPYVDPFDDSELEDEDEEL